METNDVFQEGAFEEYNLLEKLVTKNVVGATEISENPEAAAADCVSGI